jgi:periplasmic protein TonB
LASTTYRPRTAQDETPLRRRVSGFALAVAIELLLLLAFLTIDFRDRPKPEFKGGSISTFDLAASQDKAAKSEQQAAATRPPVRPERPAVKPRIVLPPRPLDLLPMSREELEASDIAKLGSNAPGAALAEGGAPGDSERVGTGPNGEPLYAAEWYREPTNQELSAYMPKHLYEDGWGMVACKTVARFHVEDCVELGQTPGSHLAGAVRQAAWQFLVRPPRVGGKSLVGTWVRIRIDYEVRRSATD